MKKSSNRLFLVIGGAGSGKSEFAEKLAAEIFKTGHLYYVATMSASDDESVRKIQKHVVRRTGTPFETVELPTDVGGFAPDHGDVILLECMSNLLANEMFQNEETNAESCDENIADECAHGNCSEKFNSDKYVQKIYSDIEKLHATCDMVIVSNEVSLDGCDYDETTLAFIKNLCEINRRIAAIADEVIEVVAGIPVYVKRG